MQYLQASQECMPFGLHGSQTARYSKASSSSECSIMLGTNDFPMDPTTRPNCTIDTLRLISVDSDATCLTSWRFNMNREMRMEVNLVNSL